MESRPSADEAPYVAIFPAHNPHEAARKRAWTAFLEVTSWLIDILEYIRYRNQMDVPDGEILSSVFVKLLQGIESGQFTYQGVPQFYSLTRLLVRQVLAEYKKNGERYIRLEERIAQETSLHDHPSNPEDDVELDDLLDEMRSELDQLSAKRRVVIELQIVAGLNDAEIAEILGITGRAVRKRRHDAIVQLSQTMG